MIRRKILEIYPSVWETEMTRSGSKETQELGDHAHTRLGKVALPYGPQTNREIDWNTQRLLCFVKNGVRFYIDFPSGDQRAVRGTILLRDFLEPDEILDDRDSSVRMEEGEGILEPDEILDDRDRSVRYGGRRRYSRTR
ncbi:hypothetical protein RRG08_047870 [Elysia crispata]|uniref:Uncharacterized protein n=1 Tax=Elysia crispata TaxID=231223 RepID=A0AAE0ZYG2_9GAST|nr:hypothetical protein RRG08_047870 [Elysia crispata]